MDVKPGKCAVAKCNELTTRPALISKTSGVRGKGTQVNREATMLLHTYFHFKSANPSDVLICKSHVKEWHNFHRNFKNWLVESHENIQDSFHVTDEMEGNQSVRRHVGDQDDSICFDKFPSGEKITHTILECLDYQSLKSLMLTNNFWLKRVKEYLADDAPRMRFCVKELLVDRSRDDSSWKETYFEFQKEKKTMVDIQFEYNCLSLREMHERIWEDFLSSAASGSGLCRILHGLDMKRKPTNMEIYCQILARQE